MGVKSNSSLFNEIRGVIPNCYNVGDSLKVGRIADATESAYQTAIKIK